MEKNSIAKQIVTKPRHRQTSKARQVERGSSSGPVKQTVGLDLGDKSSRSVATTRQGFSQAFAKMVRSRIALEVGTHSPRVSRLLESLGHEVIVANARRVRMISKQPEG